MIKYRELLIAVNLVANPMMSSLILVGLTLCYQVEFEDGYFALLLLSSLLVFKLIDNVNFESNNKVFWKKDTLNILAHWFIVGSILLLVGFTFKVTDYYSRQVLLLWLLITPVVIIIAHWLFRFFLSRYSFPEREIIKAVIVGLNNSSLKLANAFKNRPLVGVLCVGFFDDRFNDDAPKRSVGNSRDLLGKVAAVAEFVKVNKIQQVYIALPIAAQPRILALMDDLRDTTASIYFLPDMALFDLMQSGTRIIDGIPLLAACESPHTGINSVTKRTMDVTLSLFILLLITPLLLLIAIGIKLGSPGPVIFKQRRYGLDGEEIIVYKFRSMVVMEEGEQVIQATRSDPRFTRLGAFLRKTSLDELPQFINVLQGRMSIVGPRPHAVSHNELYRSLIKGYMVRHKVRPGITGWAQVNGFRGETDTIQKMRSRIYYDLEYERNWSIFLDLFIILKTIYVVIWDKHAY